MQQAETDGKVINIVELLSKFGKDSIPIAQKGLATLLTLSFDSNSAVSYSGGIPVVCQIMKHHVANQVIAANGCLLLALIAIDHEKRTAIGDAGGLQVLVLMAQQHGLVSLAVAEYS